MDAEDVLEALSQRGHRITGPRRAIVGEIMGTHDHIAPLDVLERVRKRMPEVNASTVYRTLELLEDLGVVAHSHLGQGSRYHHADRRDHVHLVCSVCRRTLSIPESRVRNLERGIERDTGFAPDLTHFAIQGVCARCRSVQRA